MVWLYTLSRRSVKYFNPKVILQNNEANLICVVLYKVDKEQEINEYFCDFYDISW